MNPRITASLLYSHLECPHRVAMDAIGDPSLRDEASPFLQMLWERGVGETEACGTGACAAVVAGIRLGLLERRVDVHTRGGRLTIEWSGEGAPVMLTGPADTVFQGEVDVPNLQ